MTGMCFSDPDRELFLCTHLLDLYRTERYPHMPTFPDYPEVSRIWHWSPALPYRSPNLPGKMNFIASLHFSLQFSPFFVKIQTFFYLLYSFWDIFAHIDSLRKIMFSFIQWRKRILISCTSCKTSYNVLSHGSWVNLWGEEWGWWGCWHLVGGGGEKCKIESLQILDHWRLASLKKRLSAVNSPG